MGKLRDFELAYQRFDRLNPQIFLFFSDFATSPKKFRGYEEIARFQIGVATIWQIEPTSGARLH